MMIKTTEEMTETRYKYTEGKIFIDRDSEVEFLSDLKYDILVCSAYKEDGCIKYSDDIKHVINVINKRIKELMKSDDIGVV